MVGCSHLIYDLSENRQYGEIIRGTQCDYRLYALAVCFDDLLCRRRDFQQRKNFGARKQNALISLGQKRLPMGVVSHREVFSFIPVKQLE